MFASPQRVPGSDFDTSPYLDYTEGDISFDLEDTSQDGQQMIGAMPGDGIHEKRKMTEDDEDEEEEGLRKRAEGEDKTAKKPGRKPLTNEPTTVRS